MRCKQILHSRLAAVTGYFICKRMPIIKNRCEELLNNKMVEGLLFHYKHFWGDYNHYQGGHGWYPNEIRIIRNMPTIHSFESAQSFRHFEQALGLL